MYLLHSKKKQNASSRGSPEAQFGLNIIFDLYMSLFRNEVEHRSWLKSHLTSMDHTGSAGNNIYFICIA